ncbi:MAG: hypothetical protein WCD63_14245, partial [Terrimicrobiaceae bacterium]
FQLAEASAGERTRGGEKGPLPLLRVPFPASRRKTLFGETPNTTRGDAYAPRSLRRAIILEICFAICFALGGRALPR